MRVVETQDFIDCIEDNRDFLFSRSDMSKMAFYVSINLFEAIMMDSWLKEESTSFKSQLNKIGLYEDQKKFLANHYIQKYFLYLRDPHMYYHLFYLQEFLDLKVKYHMYKGVIKRYQEQKEAKK